VAAALAKSAKLAGQFKLPPSRGREIDFDATRGCEGRGCGTTKGHERRLKNVVMCFSPKPVLYSRNDGSSPLNINVCNLNIIFTLP
jgi:hypothetical protein